MSNYASSGLRIKVDIFDFGVTFPIHRSHILNVTPEFNVTPGSFESHSDSTKWELITQDRYRDRWAYITLYMAIQLQLFLKISKTLYMTIQIQNITENLLQQRKFRPWRQKITFLHFHESGVFLELLRMIAVLFTTSETSTNIDFPLKYSYLGALYMPIANRLF